MFEDCKIKPMPELIADTNEVKLKEYIEEITKEKEESTKAVKFWHKPSERIADLEAKLEESEKRVKDLDFRNKNLEHSLKVAPNANAGQRARIVELKEINHKLKQQLAEKENEIEDVTITHLDMLKYFIRHNSKQGIILTGDLEREIEEIEQGKKIWQTKNFNQDKISFAVEQLKKVKERILQYKYNIYDSVDTINKEDLDYIFDNQIEELKKEMK